MPACLKRIQPMPNLPIAYVSVYQRMSEHFIRNSYVSLIRNSVTGPLEYLGHCRILLRFVANRPGRQSCKNAHILPLCSKFEDVVLLIRLSTIYQVDMLYYFPIFMTHAAIF